MDNNETKDRIFHAAVDMFAANGYTSSNMRQLAKMVGIKPSSIYYHYPSKDALLDSVFNHFFLNDARYHMSLEEIKSKAKEMSGEELLKSMYVYYRVDDSFLTMVKIIKIAIGCQFENSRAKEIYNHIFYNLAVNYKNDMFKTLIDRGILKPFDYEIMAYLMTSYSLLMLTECISRELPVESFAQHYNSGVERIARLLSPLISKG